MNCSAKHVYNVPLEDFTCPNCGAKAGDFCVDESPNHECELLHAEDYLACYTQNCGYTTSGAAFSRRYLKLKSLVDCPTCKGSGKVKKGEGR